MARTSQRDLNQMAHHIESITGLSVMIDWAYGAPRLVSGDGSREISPRLPSGQLMDWMRAFLAGYDACSRPDAPSWSAMRRTNPRPRRTRRRMGLIRDVQFFREHAGGIVGERTRGALDLARAEREMQRRGWVVTWEPDQDADLSWMTDEERKREHEVWCAVLWDREPSRSREYMPNVIASLCGIVDPSREYSRVVEAELASEALARG